MIYDAGDSESEDFKRSWFDKKFDLNLDHPNLPYLIDGPVLLTESSAIMRYICNKWAPDLLGTTPEEQGTISMLESNLYDLQTTCYIACHIECAIKDYIKQAISEKLTVFNKYLADRKWLAGDNFTFVDLVFNEVLQLVDYALNGTLKFTLLVEY